LRSPRSRLTLYRPSWAPIQNPRKTHVATEESSVYVLCPIPDVGVVLLEAPEPSERRVRCSSSHVLQVATTLATLRSIRPEIWRKEKPHLRRPIMRPRANCVN
jgi:hypothetical protein